MRKPGDSINLPVVSISLILYGVTEIFPIIETLPYD
jgi:hypothetical protein